MHWIEFQPSKASVKSLMMAFLKKYVQGHFPAQTAFFSQSKDQQKFLLRLSFPQSPITLSILKKPNLLFANKSGLTY